MNPWMRLCSWLLRPLRDEHVAALEEELVDAQAAICRIEGQLSEAFRERENALASVDELSARNARLFEEMIREIDEALDAMARHRRCGCPTGRGEE